MNRITRIISVICIASLLFSACLFSLNNATAYTAKSDVLFLDFNDETGISGVTSYAAFGNTIIPESMRGVGSAGYSYETDPDDPNNKVFYFWNRRHNGHSIELGTPGSGMSDSNAFTMQPSTSYKLTFKYKVKAGSNSVAYSGGNIVDNIRIMLYHGVAAGTTGKIVISSKSLVDFNSLDESMYTTLGPKENKDTTSGVPAEYTVHKLTQNTAWETATFYFTTPSDVSSRDNVYLTISGGNSTISGNGISYIDPDQFVGVYIDDVTLIADTTVNELETFVYDFKEESTGASCYAGASHDTFSMCSQSFISGGMTYTPDKISEITNQGMVLQAGFNSAINTNAGWRFKAYIRDTDADLGHETTDGKTYGNGWLRLQADTVYSIVVKYKVTNLECSSAGITIGLSASNNLVSPNGEMVSCLSDAEQYQYSVNDDWQYIQAVVNGNDVSKNSAGESTPNAGKYVCMVPYASESNYNSPKATLLIESVTVTACPIISGKAYLFYSAFGGEMSNGAVSDRQVCNIGDKIDMPTPTRAGYIFAGWTKSKSIAAGTAENTDKNMIAEYAPATTVIVDKQINMYYAIWAPVSHTFDFGNTTEGSKFNGSIGTTEVSASTGWVSRHISLVDYDGDGDYELRFDASVESNAWKVNLADYNSTTGVRTPYIVREGVNYTIELKVRFLQLNSNNYSVVLGLTRVQKGAFGLVDPRGSNEYSSMTVYSGGNTTDGSGYETVTMDFTSFGIFNTSYNGSWGTAGYPTHYKDNLALIGSNGEIIVDEITIKANYYENNKTVVTCSDEGESGGTVEIDYINKLISVTPNTGYKLAAGGIKMNYNYHTYDVDEFGTYKETLEQRNYVTAVYGFSKKIFLVGDAEDASGQGSGLVFKYTDDYNTSPDGLRFDISFVKDTEVSCSLVASSIRTGKVLTSGEYRSAGIRFRGRVNNNANITEVGFIVVPTQLLPSTDLLEFNSDGNVKCANAQIAVAYNSDKNVVYDSTGQYKDYQVIITGLTSENGNTDLRDIEFTVVMYIKSGSGSNTVYTYSNQYNLSWLDIYDKYDDSVKTRI